MISSNWVDMSEEIINNPKKKSFTYTLKNADEYTSGIEYTTDVVSSVTFKSLKGQNLSLNVYTTDNRELTFTFNNLSNVGDIMILINNITMFYGNLRQLYSLMSDSIEWFPSSGTTKSATGTQFGDSISAYYNNVGVTIDGKEGNDSIEGSDYKDNIKGGIGNDLVDAGEGDDAVNGDAGHDYLYGGEGNDKLIGGDGNDTIDGGDGNDALTGGAGVNTYIYDHSYNIGSDTITLTKNETANILMDTSVTTTYSASKNGSDLIIDRGSLGSVTVKNALKDTSSEVLINGVNIRDNQVLDTIGASYFNPPSPAKTVTKYTGTSAADVVSAEGAYPDSSSSITPAEVKGFTIDGKDGNDTITGSSFKDTLLGGAGDDSIVASAGNDVITGGSGVNTLDYTTISGYNSDTITLTKNEKLYINLSDSASYSASKNGSDLIIDQGSKGSITVKNGVKDTSAEIFINGDNIRENLFFDSVDGGYFNPSSSSKPVTKYTGTAVSDFVSAEGAVPTIPSPSSVDAKGFTIDTKEGNDTILGSDYSDTLTGGAGDDSIYGGTGNDVLNGGDGDDMLEGGAGNDSISGGTGVNTVYYMDNTLATYGQDTIAVTKNEELHLNFYDDTSVTAKGNDLIVGIADNKGSVTIKNGVKDAANAEIFINGLSMSKNQFLDTVDETYFNPSSSSKPQTKYTGTAVADVVDASHSSPGSAKGFTIDTKEGNDTIIGSGLNDTLLGGAGDDSIQAGAGNDAITGGAGKNYLVYNDPSVSNYGNDTITVTKNEELHLELSGSANYSASKNGSDLIIDQGSKGTITIKNGLKDASAEIFINDTSMREAQFLDTISESYFNPTSTKIVNKYTGTAAADVVDAQNASPTYSSSSSSAVKGFNIDGKEGNDTIIGNWANDTLIGGSGNDSILGDFGEDSIVGGDGDDVLNGEYGNDTIVGGAGNDSIDGGSGANTFIYKLGDGNDTIVGGSGGYDTAVFDNGTDIQVGFSDNNLLIEYSGKLGKNMVSNTITAENLSQDMLYNYGLHILQVGKTKALVKDYLADDNHHYANSFDSSYSGLIIEQGGNDTLTINANADDLRVIFNVCVDDYGSGWQYWFEENHTVFVDKGAYTGSQQVSVLSTLDPDDYPTSVPGLTVLDSSYSGIENVETNDVALLDKNAWCWSIAENVASWLYTHDYESTVDAIQSGDNITALAQLYNVSYSSAILS